MSTMLTGFSNKEVPTLIIGPTGRVHFMGRILGRIPEFIVDNLEDLGNSVALRFHRRSCYVNSYVIGKEEFTYKSFLEDDIPFTNININELKVTHGRIQSIPIVRNHTYSSGKEELLLTRGVPAMSMQNLDNGISIHLNSRTRNGSSSGSYIFKLGDRGVIYKVNEGRETHIGLIRESQVNDLIDREDWLQYYISSLMINVIEDELCVELDDYGMELVNGWTKDVALGRIQWG